MKKFVPITAALALLASSASFAATADQQQNDFVSGFMLGGQLNGQFVKYPEQTSIGGQLAPFGGRVYVGYRFDNNWGVEVGYDTIQSESQSAQNGLGPDHTYLSGGDILATKLFPMTRHFGLLLKGGAAILNEDIYNKFWDTDAEPLIDMNDTNVMPMAVVGLRFAIIKHLELGLNFTHIQKVSQVPSVEQIGLSVSAVF